MSLLVVPSMKSSNVHATAALTKPSVQISGMTIDDGLARHGLISAFLNFLTVP